MAEDLDERNLTQLLGYIGLVRDELRMQNWEIFLRTDPHDVGDNVNAHTWSSDNHWSIVIQLSPTFFKDHDDDPEGVRNVVVHELIHAQHRDVSVMWEGCILNNSVIAEAEAKTWDCDFKMHMERFVSWITRRIENQISLWDPRKEYRILEGCRLKRENSSPSE